MYLKYKIGKQIWHRKKKISYIGISNYKKINILLNVNKRIKNIYIIERKINNKNKKIIMKRTLCYYKWKV